MWEHFASEYLAEDGALQLLSHEVTTTDEGATLTAQLLVDGEHRTVMGTGSGPLAAFVNGLAADLGINIDIVDYSEHAVGSGSDATAVAYVESLVARRRRAVGCRDAREHPCRVPSGRHRRRQPPAGVDTRRLSPASGASYGGAFAAAREGLNPWCDARCGWGSDSGW